MCSARVSVQRRRCLIAALAWWAGPSEAGESLASAMRRATDPTAHAEMEAIRDAARRLGTRDLSGAVLVSTSRPCRMCEAAAGWAGIARMVHGPALTDAAAPR